MARAGTNRARKLPGNAAAKRWGERKRAAREEQIVPSSFPTQWYIKGFRFYRGGGHVWPFLAYTILIRVLRLISGSSVHGGALVKRRELYLCDASVGYEVAGTEKKADGREGREVRARG